MKQYKPTSCRCETYIHRLGFIWYVVSHVSFWFYQHTLISTGLFHFCLRIVKNKKILLLSLPLACLLKVAIFNDVYNLHVFSTWFDFTYHFSFSGTLKSGFARYLWKNNAKLEDTKKYAWEEYMEYQKIELTFLELELCLGSIRQFV